MSMPQILLDSKLQVLANISSFQFIQFPKYVVHLASLVYFRLIMSFASYVMICFDATHLGSMSGRDSMLGYIFITLYI